MKEDERKKKQSIKSKVRTGLQEYAAYKRGEVYDQSEHEAQLKKKMDDFGESEEERVAKSNRFYNPEVAF